MLEEGAILKIHDPKVTKTQIERDLGISEKIIPDKIDNQKRYDFEGSWSYVQKFINSFEDADAVVVLTEWPEYAEINWEIVANKMRKPSWVFDARSIVSSKEVINSNINFWKIGDGSIR